MIAQATNTDCEWELPRNLTESVNDMVRRINELPSIASIENAELTPACSVACYERQLGGWNPMTFEEAIENTEILSGVRAL
jgi:hypothetical protein